MIPHLTETARLEDRIVAALKTIRQEWDHMLPVGAPAVRLGGGARAVGIVADYSEPERPAGGAVFWLADHSDARDVDVTTRLVSVRRDVQDRVNSWSRVVAEDRPVTKALPDGTDVRGMCDFLERHARWMSGHDAAPDMADELEVLVASIAGIVTPEMSQDEYLRTKPAERLLIGHCTEEREREDLQIKPCRGRVFAYPEGENGVDEHDPDDPWAMCERCGSRAVVSVWLRWFFPEVVAEMERAEAGALRDRALGMSDVISLAKREFGKPVTQQAIWQWVSRGELHPIDRTTKPHTFRLGDVVDLLARKVG